MGRTLQYVDEPKRIFEITARCIQGRCLLRPSPACNRRILGVFARSLEVCEGHVELYLAGGTSKHMHFIVGVTDADWKARWKSHVFTNLSKEIGDLHDWPGPMFERRARDIPAGRRRRARRPAGVYARAVGERGAGRRVG